MLQALWEPCPPKVGQHSQIGTGCGWGAMRPSPKLPSSLAHRSSPCTQRPGGGGGSGRVPSASQPPASCPQHQPWSPRSPGPLPLRPRSRGPSRQSPPPGPRAPPSPQAGLALEPETAGPPGRQAHPSGGVQVPTQLAAHRVPRRGHGGRQGAAERGPLGTETRTGTGRLGEDPYPHFKTRRSYVAPGRLGVTARVLGWSPGVGVSPLSRELLPLPLPLPWAPGARSLKHKILKKNKNKNKENLKRS